MSQTISHAIVLPDRDFATWLEPVRPYMQAFERVAVVRSPAGNDLNRFHTVTAVQVPNVWFNDNALEHIRRAYPMVVRIDVIYANTPVELGRQLQQRIQANDRYGERQTVPRHLFERFVLNWPTKTRPARILRGFSTRDDVNPDVHEGVDITASPGAEVMAAAEGQVTTVFPGRDALNYGGYVQVMSELEGQTYIVTYGGLQDIQVEAGQRVKVGDVLARAEGASVKLVVQNPPHGLGGMKLPNVVDPTDMIYWQGIRLRPNVGALRVRSAPGTHGEIVGLVTSSDLVETAEPHGRTLLKTGREGSWLRIRYASARQAYSAAWFLDVVGANDPVEAIPGVSIPGMNLDIDNRLGTPEPTQLQQLGWVRLAFNISLNPNFPPGDPRRHGNTDVQFAFNRYLPVLERYARAGLKVILVFTHQTFGEGQGYVWPQMDSGRWRDLTGKFAAIVRQAVTLLRGRDLVHVYQIWNEQDTFKEYARAAVSMPAADYGHLLTETIRAIRTVDPVTPIITGGHATGPDVGSAYARATLDAMPGGTRPDGIAMHPYGRGPTGSRFSIYGHIGEAVRYYQRVMPDKPLWITEWGVLDQQGNDSIAQEVTQYASGFLASLKHQFPGQIAAAIWYAWADGMDNGYGLVTANGQPRQPLYDTFLRG
ncbi:MAG: peptidoglycan DD-metalloendopeptidase family protein [Chloroflexota bacterium]